MTVPAEKNGAAMDPVEELANKVDDERKRIDDMADEPLTIADIAAAAVTALETLLELLPPHIAGDVFDAFEQRAADFKVTDEAGTA